MLETATHSYIKYVYTSLQIMLNQNTVLKLVMNE